MEIAASAFTQLLYLDSLAERAMDWFAARRLFKAQVVHSELLLVLIEYVVELEFTRVYATVGEIRREWVVLEG